MPTSVYAGPNLLPNHPSCPVNGAARPGCVDAVRPARPNQRYCHVCHAAKTRVYRQKRNELEVAWLAPVTR